MLGDDWTDLGLIDPNATKIFSLCYLGKDPNEDGIVLAGAHCAAAPGAGNRVIRSTDFGATWTNLGQIGINADQTGSFGHDGLGHVFAGFGTGVPITAGGELRESLDWGATWIWKWNWGKTQQVIVKCGGNIWNVGGSRVLIAAFATIVRSLDNGATWPGVEFFSLDAANTHSVSPPDGLIYLGGGVVLAGTSRIPNAGRIYRSANNGANGSWNCVFNGGAASKYVLSFAVGEDGIIVAAQDDHIRRSSDGGLTWNDMGVVITPGNILYQIEYFQHPVDGNLFLAVANNGEVIRSVDNGITWVSLGIFTTGAPIERFSCLINVENQIAYAGSNTGHLYKAGALIPPPLLGAPHDLLCEQKKNPTDVTDPQPEFSAIFHGG